MSEVRSRINTSKVENSDHELLASMSFYNLGRNCFIACRLCAYHEEQFYCIKCKLGFSTIRGFRKHLASSSKHQFCCVTCHKDFPTSNTLTQHFKSSLHLNSHGAVIKCPECGSTFNKPSGLAMHFERTQTCTVQLYRQDFLTGIKLWEEYSGDCGFLTQPVANGSCPETRRSNVATQSSCVLCKYVCHLCQRPFKELNSLSIHLIKSTRHKLEDPPEIFRMEQSHVGGGYVCFLCFKLFKDLNGLNSHIEKSRRHKLEEYDESAYSSNSENFHCKGCGKRCKQLSTLLKHLEEKNCTGRKMKTHGQYMEVCDRLLLDATSQFFDELVVFLGLACK